MTKHAHGFEHPGVVAWVHLQRVHDKIQRYEASLLARYGLTLSQFDVLAQLNGSEALTQQALADRLLVTKGNVAGLIDRMEAQGWLERQDDPSDRRAKRLYLTETGRALAQAVLPVHADLLKGLLNRLPRTTQQQLRAILRQLDRGLGGSTES